MATAKILFLFNPPESLNVKYKHGSSSHIGALDLTVSCLLLGCTALTSAQLLEAILLQVLVAF